MAYTGTGTQDDPYLVSTLTDFLTCAKMSNKYVKVISDIDAADDENYTGEITESITIGNRTMVYADEPKVISGITCTYYTLFHLEFGANITNLFFSNIEHRPTRYSDVISVFLFDNTSAAIRNVTDNSKFSVRLDFTSNVSKYLKLFGSASSVKCTPNNSAFDVTINFNELKNNIELITYGICPVNCNITIRNLTIGSLSESSDVYFTSPSSGVYLTRCGVVFENLNLVAGYLELLSNYINTYFAFVDSVFTGKLYKYENVGGGSGNLICFQDCTDGEGNPKTTDTGFEDSPPFDVVTPEQLRSKEYLTGIGFLP